MTGREKGVAIGVFVAKVMQLHKIQKLIQLAGLPVFVASLCCLAPIVLVALGLSTVSFAVSLTNVLDGQYRWLFDLAGVGLLAVGLVVYFRRRGICTLDQARRHRNEIINQVLLATIVAAVGYYVFFFVLLGWLGRLLKLWD